MPIGYMDDLHNSFFVVSKLGEQRGRQVPFSKKNYEKMMDDDEFERLWQDAPWTRMREEGQPELKPKPVQEQPGKMKRRQKTKIICACDGCRATPCGRCRACRDMPRFGGSGIRKQGCMNRLCIRVDDNENSRKNDATSHVREEIGPPTRSNPSTSINNPMLLPQVVVAIPVTVHPFCYRLSSNKTT